MHKPIFRKAIANNIGVTRNNNIGVTPEISRPISRNRNRKQRPSGIEIGIKIEN